MPRSPRLQAGLLALGGLLALPAAGAALLLGELIQWERPTPGPATLVAYGCAALLLGLSLLVFVNVAYIAISRHSAPWMGSALRTWVTLCALGTAGAVVIGRERDRREAARFAVVMDGFADGERQRRAALEITAHQQRDAWDATVRACEASAATTAADTADERFALAVIAARPVEPPPSAPAPGLVPARAALLPCLLPSLPPGAFGPPSPTRVNYARVVGTSPIHLVDDRAPGTHGTPLADPLPRLPGRWGLSIGDLNGDGAPETLVITRDRAALNWVLLGVAGGAPPHDGRTNKIPGRVEVLATIPVALPWRVDVQSVALFRMQQPPPQAGVRPEDRYPVAVAVPGRLRLLQLCIAYISSAGDALARSAGFDSTARPRPPFQTDTWALGPDGWISPSDGQPRHADAIRLDAPLPCSAGAPVTRRGQPYVFLGGR